MLNLKSGVDKLKTKLFILLFIIPAVAFGGKAQEAWDACCYLAKNCYANTTECNFSFQGNTEANRDISYVLNCSNNPNLIECTGTKSCEYRASNGVSTASAECIKMMNLTPNGMPRLSEAMLRNQYGNKCSRGTRQTIRNANNQYQPVYIVCENGRFVRGATDQEIECIIRSPDSGYLEFINESGTCRKLPECPISTKLGIFRKVPDDFEQSCDACDGTIVKINGMANCSR
jgi:hypothetical protein